MSGCPYIQGPACWDCSGSCWDLEEEPEPGPPECDGSDTCPAPWHVHGCINDGGGCTEPHEHVIAAETPRQRFDYQAPLPLAPNYRRREWETTDKETR